MGGSSNQVSPDGARNKGVAELNDDINYVHKEVRDGIVGEGQGLSEEDESRINESAINRNDGHEGDVATVALQAGLHKQQQQQLLPPSPVVLWERILPVRTLKVLLVESDDSTRQVVTALLRNCSYVVIAIANGSQAWKILENPTNHIDLVLTEVAMPGGLSGIGLLSKIMNNDACKNIPVIMMSSNDSMGTVFKCLSKGAVDFLVKPIRKNELKNLWQHVWRRSHSSSGSVSESGIQTQKSSKSKSANDSDNNSSSNNEDDNASIDMNARDGSDNGSGTQSSWRKHAVEVDSPEPMSPSDQLADPHDSTCAQVISDSEIFCNNWVSMTANRKCQEKNKHPDALMGKYLEIGVPRNPDIHPESHPIEKIPTKLTGKSMDKQPESDKKNEDALGLESSNAFSEPSIKAANLIDGIASNTDAQLVNGVTDTPNGFSRISESKAKNDDSKELPSLQLSLKRLRSTGDDGNATHDDRKILRRSDQSAFSRYRTSTNSTQAPTGYVGSCSLIDNSSDVVKTESTQNMISNSNPIAVKQGSDSSSNNNDKGSSTKPAAYKEKAAPTLAVKSIHASAFHPVRARTSSQQAMQEKIDDMEATEVAGQPIEVQRQYKVQHHHHHYHHHHHHVHGMQKQKQKQQLQQPSEYDDLSCQNMTEVDQYCGSSNVFTLPNEGNAANYSLHGSNSGSNHGSNGKNRSSAAVNTGANMETAGGIAEKCGVGGGNGSGSGSGSGVDQNRLAQREAALNKFRQKRKERNFGKKVRYQSRKRLAEQRPRVRGQFVRQPVQEPKSREQDS